MSAAQPPAPSAPETGDFFVYTWGYDQTNVEFFKVVGLTPSGKSVRLQAWSKAVVEESLSATHVVPGERATGQHVQTKRLSPDLGTWYVSFDHGSGSLWDGRPRYETAIGWGH